MLKLKNHLKALKDETSNTALDLLISVGLDYK